MAVAAPRIAYICHAYAAQPSESVSIVRRICRSATKSKTIPLAPQLLFPQFLDEATDRELAMSFCLRLVAVCDEVRVYGDVSDGMWLEIAEARRLGIPVVDGETGERLRPKGEPPR